MKLIYGAIAGVLGVSSAAENTPAPKTCIDGKSIGRMLQGYAKISQKEFDDAFPVHLHQWFQANSFKIDEVCSSSLEKCAALKVPDAEKKAAWEEITGGSSECGNDAYIHITSLVTCAMCKIHESPSSAHFAATTSADNDINGLNKFKAESPDDTDVYFDLNPFLTSIIGIGVNSVKKMLPVNNPFDLADSSVDTDNKEQSFDYHLRLTIQQLHAIVNTGGPNYCKEMMPKFPRLHFGHMGPSDTNWEIMKNVRDACVANLIMIHKMKCLCKFMYWGEKQSFPNNAPNWFIKKFGSDASDICWYLRDLHAVAYNAPRVRPSSPNCLAAGQFAQSQEPRI